MLFGEEEGQAVFNHVSAFPIINAGTVMARGAEVCARWQHGTLMVYGSSVIVIAGGDGASGFAQWVLVAAALADGGLS